MDQCAQGLTNKRRLFSRYLVLPVLLAGAESLVSGHRVKGLREATARRAALDPVVASWTIGSEKTAVRDTCPACRELP